MSEDRRESHPLVSLAMVAAVVLTAVFAVWLVRYFIHVQQSLMAHRPSANAPAVATPKDAEVRLTAGVPTRITAGERLSELRLASADFTLNPGESLDPVIEPGPFRAEFTVRFWSGNVRQTRLGADLRGGKLMILHAGQPVLAEAVGERARSVMSSIALTVDLARDVDQLTIIIENDGRRPCGLRLLWQPLSPEPAPEPTPLPVPR